MKKYFYAEHILALFNKKRNKVDILIDALDEMQAYNGRSKTDCIALAMGFEYTSDENGNHCYLKENL